MRDPRVGILSRLRFLPARHPGRQHNGVFLAGRGAPEPVFSEPVDGAVGRGGPGRPEQFRVDVDVVLWLGGELMGGQKRGGGGVWGLVEGGKVLGGKEEGSLDGGRKGRWRDREEEIREGGGNKRKRWLFWKGLFVEEYVIREGWNRMDGFC